MRCVYGIMILFVIFILPITVSANSFEIIPEHPVVGDTITIKGSAASNEKLDVSIDFEKIEKVAQGNKEYKYVLDFENPLKSNFAVRAEKVEKLNAAVKIVIWWTLSANANSEHVATISQNNVPKGKYQIKVYGTAAPEQSSVLLKIKASSIIKADNNGKFEYSYTTTKDFPVGTYNLNINGVKRSITLSQRNEKQGKDKPEKEEKEKKDNNKDDRNKNDDKVSEHPPSTPGPTETPEIKETSEKAPTSKPTPASDKIETKSVTLIQRFLNFFKFQ